MVVITFSFNGFYISDENAGKIQIERQQERLRKYSSIKWTHITYGFIAIIQRKREREREIFGMVSGVFHNFK